MSHFGDLIGGKKTPVSKPVPIPVIQEPPSRESFKVEEKPKRARNEDGHFIADDPSTPENEAWVGGVSPSKKKTKKKSSAS